MNAFLPFERAIIVGFAALAVALVAQTCLENRVPAAWRVWIWRVALLQTALSLVPLSPLRLAVLPPHSTAKIADFSSKSAIETPFQAAENLVSRAVEAKSGDSTAPREFKISPPDSAAAPDSASSPLWSQPEISPSQVAPSQVAPSQVAPSGFSPSRLPSLDAFTSMPKSRNFYSPRDFWPLALSVYALGLLFHFGALARSFHRVRRLLRACTSIEGAECELALMRGARRIGAAPPRLLVQREGAPFLVGVLAPAVVLPLELLHSRGANLDAVLHHELAHLKRRDLVWNLVLWPIETAFWFHPLVWAARHFLPLETESACDEMVLGATPITPRTYGALLLNTMNCEQNPLTAGVSDGFAAFKTRLKRLNRTPKTPRRAAKIAFGVALSGALIALVPLRLETRAAAQVEAAVPSISPSISASNAAPTSNLLRGTVRDKAGKPVAGATVYALNEEEKSDEPLETVTSNARGEFEFSPQIRVDSGRFGVFADAGARGMGDAAISHQIDGPIAPVDVLILPTARATLRFLDPQNRPAVGLTVHFLSVSGYVRRQPLRPKSRRPEYRQMTIPRPYLAGLQAKTNARGEAVFPLLPSGSDARFWAGDRKPGSAWNGTILYRGEQFAPLRLESSLGLSLPDARKTIRLVKATGISGRITLPDGDAAYKAVVSAREIHEPDGVYHLSDRSGGNFGPQALSDGNGNYQLEGLRPGRYLIQVFPRKDELKEFVGPISEIVIGATRRVDFRLSRGVVVEGNLVGRGTNAPVVGQIIDLHDTSSPHRRYYYDTKTDARGHFRFHVLAGPQHLRLKSEASGRPNMPPSGFALPAKSDFDFALADGARRHFQIIMPLAPPLKPVKAVTGQVVGPNGTPVMGATVIYQLAGLFNPQDRSVSSDASGHFTIPREASKRPLQLFADQGEATTPRSTLALSGDVVRLQLQPKAWASLEGRVTDEKNQPIAGADVNFSADLGGSFYRNDQTKTDAAGRYQFLHLRPGTGAMLVVMTPHFSPFTQFAFPFKPGEFHRLDFPMKVAPKTLRGQVLNEDGAPASGFCVEAKGQIRGENTRADGRFFLSQVVDGPLDVRISKGLTFWKPFPARGGDQNLVIRLSKTKIEDDWRNYLDRLKPNKLLGQSAPEICAASWSGKPISLSSQRGKVVFLSFGWFNYQRNFQIEAFARAMRNRVQIVGIQGHPHPDDKRNFDPKRPIDIAAAARENGFPIALDALDSSGPQQSDGQTHARYQGAKFVVIGRDGKIRFAGQDFDRAIVAADAASRAG